MKDKDVQKDYLRRLTSLKKQLLSECSWIDVRDLLQIMGRLGHYHYNRKNAILLGRERELYDLLIRNNYNPYTVYRWLLLERLPENIKYQIKEHKISQKKAVSEAFKQKQETAESISATVQEMGLALIRGM